MKKSGLGLAPLLTWNFSNLLLTTTTLQSSKPRNFTILLLSSNSGTQLSTNYYIELPNFHFLHLSIWIPYINHLQHFSQTKFTNFDLQFYLAPPLPHHICQTWAILFPSCNHCWSLCTLIKFSWHFLWSWSNPYLSPQCKSVLPTITNIINLSMSTGVFPDQFKNCSEHPLLKKSNLDKEKLSNYRPISHLSILPIKTHRTTCYNNRLVNNRLVDHLNENNPMNSFQSAYTKFNSTETTYFTCCTQPHYQSHESTASHLSVSSWSFCRLWHYWLYHSSASTRILVWFHWHCLILHGFSLTFHLVPLRTVDINGIKSPSKLLYGVSQGSVVLFLVLYSSYTLIQLHSVQ